MKKENDALLNYAPAVNTVLLVITILLILSGSNAIQNKVESMEIQRVGWVENYKLIQEIYNSDKFKEQQKQGIKQSLDQMNGNAAAAQPTAEQPIAAKTDLSQDEIATLTKDIPLKWAKNPKIIMIEYSDMECPFCKKLHTDWAYNAVLAQYPNDVAVSFKHFPLNFHVNAQKEAEAAECVLKIGWSDKYFAFVDGIFEKTTAGGQGFALADLAPLAAELGLNQTEVQTCIDSNEMAPIVAAQMAEWQKYGVTGTPGNVIINIETGKWTTLAWAVPASTFLNAVETLLK